MFVKVTLSACSAAFAAMSTAILCIILLNGKSSEDLLHGRAQSHLTSIHAYHLDAPHNDQARVRCISEDELAASLPTQRQYGRRAISSYNAEKIIERDQVAEGVAWLMVSLCTLLLITFKFASL